MNWRSLAKATLIVWEMEHKSGWAEEYFYTFRPHKENLQKWVAPYDYLWVRPIYVLFTRDVEYWTKKLADYCECSPQEISLSDIGRYLCDLCR